MMNSSSLWFWQHPFLGSPDRWADEDDAQMIAESVERREQLTDDDVEHLKSLDAVTGPSSASRRGALA
jgi:hypothetical protein